ASAASSSTTNVIHAMRRITVDHDSTRDTNAMTMRTASGRSRMFLPEQLDHAAIELGDVVRLAARDDRAVAHHRLVDPRPTRIVDVRHQRRPRRPPRTRAVLLLSQRHRGGADVD